MIAPPRLKSSVKCCFSTPAPRRGFLPLVRARRALIGIGLSLFLLSGLQAAGAPYRLEKKVDSGNDASLFVWVIMAEGYTDDASEKFAADTDLLIEAFFSSTPFKEYQSAINIYTIFVPSEESGADHPAESFYVDTAFDATYDTYGIARLLTVNDEKVFEAAAQVPYFDAAFVLVNDEQYGGSGGSVIVVSTHKASSDIALHEAGHVIGRLADEYETPYPGYPAGDWEPNVTFQSAREHIPWRAWVDPATPLPTPDDTPDTVGLFEGARYLPEGVYRPTLTSKMRSLNQPFYEVCSEALILNIYNIAHPIQQAGPEQAEVTLVPGESMRFWIEPLQLAPDSYDVVWEINDAVLENESQTSLVLVPSALKQGYHSLSAWISDLTAMVKTDSRGLLTARHTWQVAKDFCSGALSVTVIDAKTGNPLPEASVTLDVADLDVPHGSGTVFELEDAPCGRSVLLVEAPGYEDGEQNVVIQDGAETTITVSLKPLQAAYYITGSITGTIDQTVTMQLSGDTTLTAATNAAHAYVLGPAFPGTYSLTPQAPGYRFSPSARTLVVDDNLSDINFNARKTGLLFFIAGTVQGGKKQGVRLTATGPQKVTASTDSQGTFKLEGLPPGTYLLEPSYPGMLFEPGRQEIQVPERDVEGVLFLASESPCPATEVLPPQSHRLKQLRLLRDRVLMKSAMGRTYIRQYYAAGPEVISILRSDKGLRREALQTINACLPAVRMLLKGKQVRLSNEVQTQIGGLAGRLAQEASPALQQRIEKFLHDLHNEKSLLKLLH